MGDNIQSSEFPIGIGLEGWSACYRPEDVNGSVIHKSINGIVSPFRLDKTGK